MTCRHCTDEAVDSLLMAGFTYEQAEALAAAGYTILGWLVLP